MSIIAEAIAGKSFTPEQIPHGERSPIYQYTPPGDNMAQQVGDVSATSIVGLILNWFLRKFPEASLQVTRLEKGDRVPVLPHEFTDLVARPNEFYTGSKLWAGTIISYLLDGNAYWLKARNSAARVAEYWYVPHFMMEPKPSKDGRVFIDHYEYNIGGQRIDVPRSEVIHWQFGMDPSNTRKGMSQLKGQLREIYTDEQAARFSAWMLRNAGVPGLMVSPTDAAGDLTQDDANLLQAKTEAKVTGSNVGRTVVMTKAVNLEQFGFSPEQMDLRDLRALPEERVSGALGVAAAVVGLGTGLDTTKVGATMREMREMAVEDALLPLWTDFASQATDAALPDFKRPNQGDYACRFDTSEVRELQDDRDKLVERETTLFKAGGITRGTLQRRTGHEVDEAADVYLVSALLVEVPKGQTMPATKSRGMKATSSVELAYLRALDTATKQVESTFVDAIEEALAELGALAAVAYEQRVKVPVGNGRKVAEPTPDEEALAAAIIADMQLDRWREAKLSPAYQGHYSTVAIASIESMSLAYGLDIEIGLRDVVAERVLAAMGTQLGLLDIEVGTKSALFKALEQARIEGLGIPQTANLIREYVPAGRYAGGAGVKYRAQTIARTETTFARNISTVEAAKGAGFTEWVCYDNRTGWNDPDCAAADGTVVTEDEMRTMIAEEHPRGTRHFSPRART